MTNDPEIEEVANESAEPVVAATEPMAESEQAEVAELIPSEGDSVNDDVVNILTAIDKQVANVHTQSLDLSFNELLDMRKNGELDISPDFQRLFQWSEGAQSRFIESLLLEMPVPPIYVIEDDDGKYTLIDGLQRISSYLHLRGELDASHLDPPITPGNQLEFSDCDIVEELNGKSYDSLGTALQIRLKRAFVRVEVVRKGSDARFKYHMFKRLNTGGTILSPHQLRNCTIRLLDARFNDFINGLSEIEAFQDCIETITDEQRKAAFDKELVLRFLAFKNYRDHYVHDISDFLTEYMELVSDPTSKMAADFDYDNEKKIFERTFTLFARTMGARSFCYANKAKTITSGFSVYHFEAFTLGVQGILDIDLDDGKVIDSLKGKIADIKIEDAFIALTSGGGKNSRNQLKNRIEYVQNSIGG